jgi:hypothetical protein
MADWSEVYRVLEWSCFEFAALRVSQSFTSSCVQDCEHGLMNQNTHSIKVDIFINDMSVAQRSKMLFHRSIAIVGIVDS